jgi:PAS domain-containing protein
MSAIETELLSSLYETVGKTEGWMTFIDALARSYGGGKGTLAVFDAAARNSFFQAWGQWEPDQVAQYNRYYGTINPWQPQAGDLPVGMVLVSERVLPRSDLFKTEHYNDFLRPAQVCDGVGVTIQKDDSRHCAITVLFPQSTAERDTDTVGRLQRLVPHIRRVTQLNRQLAGLETRGIAAEALLDRLATAIIVVNATGHVVYMNATAEQVIKSGDGPKVIRLVLDAVRHGEGKLLRQLIASARQMARNIAAPPSGVMRISRQSGCAPYEVLVAPVSGKKHGAVVRACCVITKSSSVGEARSWSAQRASLELLAADHAGLARTSSTDWHVPQQITGGTSSSAGESGARWTGKLSNKRASSPEAALEPRQHLHDFVEEQLTLDIERADR